MIVTMNDYKCVVKTCIVYCCEMYSVLLKLHCIDDFILS